MSEQSDLLIKIKLTDDNFFFSFYLFFFLPHYTPFTFYYSFPSFSCSLPKGQICETQPPWPSFPCSTTRIHTHRNFIALIGGFTTWGVWWMTSKRSRTWCRCSTCSGSSYWCRRRSWSCSPSRIYSLTYIKKKNRYCFFFLQIYLCVFQQKRRGKRERRCGQRGEKKGAKIIIFISKYVKRW